MAERWFGYVTWLDEIQHLPQAFWHASSKQYKHSTLWEPNGYIYTPQHLQQLLTEAINFARALTAFNFQPGQRVAIIAPVGRQHLAAQLGTMLLGGTVVLMPEHWPQADQLRALRDSRTRILVTTAASLRTGFSGSIQSLADLQLVVSLDGGPEPAGLTIRGSAWKDFIVKGSSYPDRTLHWLRERQADEGVLMFYEAYDPLPRVRLYTNADIAGAVKESARSFVAHGLRLPEGDEELRVLTLPPGAHFNDWVVGYWLPLLLGAKLYRSEQDLPDDSIFQTVRPHWLIGSGRLLSQMKQRYHEDLRFEGRLDRWLLARTLEYGRAKYEKKTSSGIMTRPERWLLGLTIIQTLRNRLGRKLQAIISTDEAVAYESLLFFQAFEIQVLETPNDPQEQLEKRI